MLRINGYDKKVLSGTMYDVLAENADEFKERYAMEYFGRKYTYGRLFEDIENIRKSLVACGLKRGERVAVSLITTPQSVALMYACSALGISTVMLDVRYGREELIDIIKISDCRMLFIMDWNSSLMKGIEDIIPGLKTVVVSPTEDVPEFIGKLRKIGHFFKGNLYRESSVKFGWKTFLAKGNNEKDPGETCHFGSTEVFFSTSGTTGKRKLVTLNNEKLNREISQHFLPDLFPKQEGKFLSMMPLFACYGWVVSVHLPLTLGIEIMITPIYDSSKVPGLIAKKKPEYFSGVPAFFESMLTAKELKETDLSFIRGLISGGESMSAQKQDAFNDFLKNRGCKVRLRQGYGMTELSAGAFMQMETDYSAGSVGNAMDLTEVMIDDNGEICIHTPCMMLGYLGDQEETDKVIRVHDDGRAWVHTGDLGHFDSNGSLVIEGRIKKMIVTENGTKIFPNHIENEIMNIEGIGDCAVVPVKRNGCTCVECLKLFVVPDRNSDMNARHILNRIKKELGTEQYRSIISDDIRICRSIPLTGYGKHDYRKLQIMALS